MLRLQVSRCLLHDVALFDGGRPADLGGVVESLATPLALIEFFGTLIVLVLLGGALISRRRDPTPAVVIAVVFGIVFANPVGVVAERSATDQRPVTPSAHADGSRHWVKLAGIPVAWFTPYNQEYPWAGAFENSPDSVLKLRHGLSLLPSTGASSVVQQCSNYIGDPCWEGEENDYPLVQHDRSGRTWVVPLTQANLNDAQGGFDRTYVPQFYEARVGLASGRALFYWLVVATAIYLGRARSRIRWSRIGLAVAGSVCVGVAISVALAAVPAQARSASSQTPALLPVLAETSMSEGKVDITPIERYAEDCFARNGHVVYNHCGRLEDLTAAETSGGILAVWMAEADRLMNLRARALSATGEPLGAGRTEIKSWSQVVAGRTSCEVPADLQATRLRRGEVLIAWSHVCQRYGAPTPITGLVVDERGRTLRGPFLITEFAPRWADLQPRFWLRSTSDGDAFLAWEDASKSLLVSRLNDRQEVEHATRLFGGENGIGSVAVACGTSCVVAHALDGTIRYRLLSSRGVVVHAGSIQEGTAPMHSELAAGASGDRFVIGWLESDGANVDARLATVRRGEAPVVETVARDIPHGDGTSATIPQPLGIAAGRARPALVWQTSTGNRYAPELRFHVTPGGAASTSEVDVGLGETSITSADVLVAEAGFWPVTPSEPVSIVVP